MSAFDSNSIFQFVGYMFFVIFMLYGTKIQLHIMLSQIAGKMKRLIFLRDSAYSSLKVHVLKYIAVISPEQEKSLKVLINSIAIPPVGNLDPAGIVPKMENIFKTYDKYLKAGLRRIVNIPNAELISQSDLENLTNSLEVSIELNVFYKVVEHFFKLAKKQGLMMVYQLSMVLPMLMEIAEALFVASGHFASGLPIGDGFGPMIARKLAGTMKENPDVSTDAETSVHTAEFEQRRLIIVKAKGPGGSVGNPGIVTQNLIREYKPELVITVDAALRLESEKTGEVAEGVGVAMGGPGMDRFRIEEALAESNIPVLTIVCKMSIKEAISVMPKDVFDQVDLVYQRVLELIRENSDTGDTVFIVGVGNSMGVP